MTIEIKIDDLNKEIYRFWENGTTLILDSYYLLNRESKRKQKWNYLKIYERLSKKDSNMLESEVPFTESIKQLVLEEYVKLLSVKTWSDCKIKK